MTEQHEHRTAYDDPETPHAMSHDCEAVVRELHLERCPHHDHLGHDPAAHELRPPQVSDELADKGRDIHLHFH